MNVFGRRRTAVRVQQLASHPEVDQENTTALESNKQILAATIERCDPLSLELRGHSGGFFGPGETRVEDLYVFEAPTHEPGLEPCTNGLDLGKLRHGRQRSAADAAVVLA